MTDSQKGEFVRGSKGAARGRKREAASRATVPAPEFFQDRIERLIDAAREAGYKTKPSLIRLRLEGEEGGDWSIDSRGGLARLVRGMPEDGAAPNIDIVIDAKTAAEVLDGRLDAVRAFLQGGVRVSGDVGHLEAVLRTLGMVRCEK